MRSLQHSMAEWLDQSRQEESESRDTVNTPTQSCTSETPKNSTVERKSCDATEDGGMEETDDNATEVSNSSGIDEEWISGTVFASKLKIETVCDLIVTHLQTKAPSKMRKNSQMQSVSLKKNRNCPALESLK